MAETVPAETSPAASQNRRQNEITYQDATLTEDVSWRGTILIKGYLVVAPQATVRIEPGTVINFMAGNSSSRQLPRLVIMGRIQAVGTVHRPILFTPRQTKPAKGSWGGILLLNSEKRNQLEHCRIDGAETGIESRFSALTTKSISVINSTNGIILRDSVASMAAGSITLCENGLEAHDSELELRDASVSENRTGMVLVRSSIVISSVSVKGNLEKGILSDDCRIKINSSEIVGNAVGARIKGGEGQLIMSRLMRNRDTALHLSAARMKINRCRIADNAGDGMLLEDGRSSAWGNDFSGNGGYNLVYNGRESVDAVLNWWGTSSESSLMTKISNTADGKRSDALNLFPWLTEKPAALP